MLITKKKKVQNQLIWAKVRREWSAKHFLTPGKDFSAVLLMRKCLSNLINSSHFFFFFAFLAPLLFLGLPLFIFFKAVYCSSFSLSSQLKWWWLVHNCQTHRKHVKRWLFKMEMWAFRREIACMQGLNKRWWTWDMPNISVQLHAACLIVFTTAEHLWIIYTSYRGL